MRSHDITVRIRRLDDPFLGRAAHVVTKRASGRRKALGDIGDLEALGEL